MIRAALLALATGIGLQAWGQTAPKYSNEFLSLGVGGRALGMGGAQVSQVNDVTAGYWSLQVWHLPKATFSWHLCTTNILQALPSTIIWALLLL